MSDDIGTFRVEVEIENPARPGERRTLTSVLVDTGAELSWVPGDVLESLGSSATSNCVSGKPTGRSSSAGLAVRSSMSPAIEPTTMSYSENLGTSCCLAHTRWKVSTFG